MKGLNNKGSAGIILCLVISALFGFTALVIDVGISYKERVRLSNAIDAAALAAAFELPKGENKAKEVAVDYLQKNGVEPSDTEIIFSKDGKAIEIKGRKKISYSFAPIIGIDEGTVNAKTKAIIAPIKSVKEGVRPLAVEVYDFSYGDLVTLKEGAGDGYKGNYGAVALGGRGASTFKANAIYGFEGTISVGEFIPTETGNMASAAKAIKAYINTEDSTFPNFSRDSIRLWTIPLVDSLDVTGRKEVQVVGFAEFYVEDVTGKSSKIEVSGRFIRFVARGATDTSLRDTGLYGARLSN